MTVAVQQKQIPGFTIDSSDQLISYGQQVTISGVLAMPRLNTPVTLWARNGSQGQFTPVADTTMGSDGSYAFTPQAPTNNTVYQVRTTMAPRRHSAVLFEGVQDALTMTPSSTTSEVGGHITFTGTVLPDKAGHVIYLQRLGADGDWHSEEIRFVTNADTFQFGWTFGKAGTYAVPRPDHRRRRQRGRCLGAGDHPGLPHDDEPVGAAAGLVTKGRATRTQDAASAAAPRRGPVR